MADPEAKIEATAEAAAASPTEGKKKRSKRSKKSAEAPASSDAPAGEKPPSEPAAELAQAVDADAAAEPAKPAAEPAKPAADAAAADAPSEPASSSSAPASSSSSPAASSSSQPKPEFRRGKIFVNVTSGNDLAGGNKINPYWKAIANPPREKLYRSEPVTKTNNPQWESTGRLLMLEDKHATLEELRIEVWL